MATFTKKEDGVDFNLESLTKVLQPWIGQVDESTTDLPNVNKSESNYKPEEEDLTDVPLEGTSVDPPTPEILPPQTYPSLTEKHPNGEKESTGDTVTEGSNKSDTEQKARGDLAARVNPYEYNFQHKSRGHFLLFNVVNFVNQKSSKREGTDADAYLLDRMFTRLGFKVSRFDDPTKKTMIKYLKAVASRDHTRSDCVAVAILTHGDWRTYKRPEDGQTAIADQIMASDDIMPLSDLTDLFRTQSCHPSLNGKPKLFFIQACRGAKLAESVEYWDGIDDVSVADISFPEEFIHKTASHVESPRQEDVLNTPTPQASEKPPFPPSFSETPNDPIVASTKASTEAPTQAPTKAPTHASTKVLNQAPKEDAKDEPQWVNRLGYSLPESMPIYKDFLVAWSTAPGYFSFRNVDRGSVFIQTLCRYLNKFHATTDLLSIITWANSDIAHQYESNAPSTVNNPDKRDIHGKKQMPWFYSRLTKDVYFRWK